MGGELLGKKALVCAATKGIGKAVACAFAAAGADVYIFGREPAALERALIDLQSRAASGVRVTGTTADLTLAADRERLVSQFHAELGGVDILVHNQGGPAPGNFADLSGSDLQASFRLCLESVWHLSELCVPDMLQAGWGRLLWVLSVSAKEPLPGMLLSNIMRPAVLGLCKSLAVELGPRGITSHAILPGSIETDRLRNLVEERARKEGRTAAAVRNEAVSRIPVGRLGQPEELANAALFLASPAAAYLNGLAIAVDGGATRAW